MKNFRSLLGFLLVIALIGGGAYFAYDKFVKEDDSSPAKECRTEKDMLADAVGQANRQGGGNVGLDPAAFIHTGMPQKYYSWSGASPDFVVIPIGSPPC